MSSINRPVQVFIPFVAAGITSSYITKLFSDKLLGKVTSIQMHDKKLVGNGKFKSAKHSYAFISVIPFDTEVGHNLRHNVEYNYTTHVMYSHDGIRGTFDVKPHLSLEDRLERGFNIIPSKSIPEYKPVVVVVQPIVDEEPTPDRPFKQICDVLTRKTVDFNEEGQRRDILNDYMDIEKSVQIERECFQEYCMWNTPSFV